LIFDQNQEKLPTDTSAEEPQEKAKSLFETSSTDSGGQEEKKPLVIVPPTPGAAPIRPIEQARPALDPSAAGAAKHPQPTPAVSHIEPAEQAKPLPTDTSSTNSLMKVILPAEKCKTNPDTSAGDNPAKKIIAVGGAKGGVGKSMLAANLAVGLSLLGQKVVLADLDLGGADVHLYTGVKSLASTWIDFLDRKVDSLQDILTPTAFTGLSLIGGDSSKLGSANLPYSQKLKIMRHLKELETDFLVVDLGGDTTLNGLDFFLLADQKIVVSGTEPASVLDSYTFIKVAFIRFLERFFSEYKALLDLATQIKDGSLEKSKNYSLDFLYQEVHARDPQASVQLKKQLDQFRLAILLHHEQETTRAELLHSANQIRREAKDQIDAGKMTLDGLTVGQINSAFKNTPRLRQSFQKILSIMSGLSCSGTMYRMQPPTTFTGADFPV